MLTKTSNDSAEWWSTVPSFYSFREASKRMGRQKMKRWQCALKHSQTALHMFYSHADLSRSYLWLADLDKTGDVDSLDTTFLRVMRRVSRALHNVPNA